MPDPNGGSPAPKSAVRTDRPERRGRDGGRLSDASGLDPRPDAGLELHPELGQVRGERHALEQVVINLLINACQACPDGPIAVGTVGQRFEPGPRDGAAEGRRADGRRARIRRVSAMPPRRRDLAPGTPGAVLYVADDGARRARGRSGADLRSVLHDQGRRAKAPGSASRSWRGPCTTPVVWCGWTARARAARCSESSCLSRERPMRMLIVDDDAGLRQSLGPAPPGGRLRGRGRGRPRAGARARRGRAVRSRSCATSACPKMDGVDLPAALPRRRRRTRSSS